MSMSELEIDDLNLEEQVAESRRAIALIEQAQQADTLPRRFERLLEDMTAGMPDHVKVVARRFANFGLDFANRAHQDTAIALDNSAADLANGRRR